MTEHVPRCTGAALRLAAVGLRIFFNQDFLGRRMSAEDGESGKSGSF